MKLDALQSLMGSTALDSTAASKNTGVDFGDVLKNAIGGTVDAQRAAEKMSAAAANGENVPMHDVIQAVGKAEITLQTMVAVRDKAVEAYQEIMRMPI